VLEQEIIHFSFVIKLSRGEFKHEIHQTNYSIGMLHTYPNRMAKEERGRP
jgi:hypothetical protein